MDRLEIVAKLNEMKTNGMSIGLMSALCGVEDATIRNIVSGNHGLTKEETLKKVRDFIEKHQFYRKPTPEIGAEILQCHLQKAVKNREIKVSLNPNYRWRFDIEVVGMIKISWGVCEKHFESDKAIRNETIAILWEICRMLDGGKNRKKEGMRRVVPMPEMP